MRVVRNFPLMEENDGKLRSPCGTHQRPATSRPMQLDPPLPVPSERGPIVFINLWPQSGMKHYSDSLVHALAPAAAVLYVRNYESSLPIDSLRVHLNAVRLGGWGEMLRLVREILRRRPSAVHLNSELPIL